MTWIYGNDCIRVFKKEQYRIDLTVFITSRHADDDVINASDIIDDVISKWENRHPKYKDIDIISAIENELELNDMKAEIYTRA